MSSFEDWLVRLGLGEVAPRLEAQGIGWRTIAGLNETQLQELGLTDGQKRRLRQAIDDLAGVAHIAELGLAEEPAPPPVLPPDAPRGLPAADEER